MQICGTSGTQEADMSRGVMQEKGDFILIR